MWIKLNLNPDLLTFTGAVQNYPPWVWMFLFHMKPKFDVVEIFNDLIISPPAGQSISTINLRKWALNLESEHREGNYIAKPVPISPPYIGIRYSADRVNFLLKKHQVLPLESANILDSLAKNTHTTQFYLPVTEGYRKSWFQRNLAHLKDVRHLRITRGGLRSRSGPVSLPAEEEGLPGSWK